MDTGYQSNGRFLRLALRSKALTRFLLFAAIGALLLLPLLHYRNEQHISQISLFPTMRPQCRANISHG